MKGDEHEQQQEFAKRRLAFEEAVATHRLEGLEPDPQTIADLERVADGRIDIEEYIKLVKDRVARGEF